MRVKRKRKPIPMLRKVRCEMNDGNCAEPIKVTCDNPHMQMMNLILHIHKVNESIR
jgi:hypothetical protein